MTAYNALLSGVFSTWSSPSSITVQAFVEFLRGVLTSLPSSSDVSAIPNLASHFGDHLVDIIWTMDAQLDVFIDDVQTEITALGAQESTQATAALVKAKKRKTAVESDKEKVHAIVKGLLVSKRIIYSLASSFLLVGQELGIVSAAACRERLDSSVLAAVGLFPELT